jgi:hypothetical protein
MSVANIDIDIVDYSGKKDFQVLHSYVSENKFTVTLKRLDSKDGWNDDMKVLVIFKQINENMTVTVGSSSVQYKTVEVGTTFNIECNDLVIKEYQDYNLTKAKNIQRISRNKFNQIFSSELVILPFYLFAVGIKNGIVYIYNESYDNLYMIDHTINSILSVALTKNQLKIFYFVISAGDGYMENNFNSIRDVPRKIKEDEFKGEKDVKLTEDSEYAVFHKDEYILGQSIQPTVSKCINVPDRYYFMMNKYNEYRSYHKGIPFSSKKNKIVFASNPRGSKYNFKTRRDIEISQREYFYSDNVPKDNIDAPNWIDKEEMVNYKYILDIDGHSSSWDATAWKLNSGSVIFKTESIWTQWFYDDYKEWVHYVPIKEDFSDIQEKYRWCESNQDRCLEMVEKCKVLFQSAYRYNNVIDHIEKQIYKINELKPNFVGDKRVFVLSNSENAPGNVNTTFLPKNEVSVLDRIKNVINKLHSEDLVFFMKAENIDANNFSLDEFYKRYLELDSKIVFGAEKNLWPGEIELLKTKLDKMAPSDSEFKYLNFGFFCAEVGVLNRILEEQIYEADETNEQAYFIKILLQKNYPITLDYYQKLVLNTYKCSPEEIEKHKARGVPFIHFNAGR